VAFKTAFQTVFSSEKNTVWYMLFYTDHLKARVEDFNRGNTGSSKLSLV
jgi:hypothetical protein